MERGTRFDSRLRKLRLLATTKLQLPTEKNHLRVILLPPCFRGMKKKKKAAQAACLPWLSCVKRPTVYARESGKKRMRISIDLLREISVVNHHHFSPPFGGFLKWWYPQIIHFNRVFHCFHHPFWGFSPLFLRKHPFGTISFFDFFHPHLKVLTQVDGSQSKLLLLG